MEDFPRLFLLHLSMVLIKLLIILNRDYIVVEIKQLLNTSKSFRWLNPAGFGAVGQLVLATSTLVRSRIKSVPSR